MKGDGFYDLHSEYQRRVIEAGDPLLARLATELDTDPASGALRIVDYGASTGATSNHAVGTVLRALAEAGNEREVMVIHNDVPTNDFSQLFRNVTGSGGYLEIGHGAVYPTACAGSFFDQVVPASTVDLGMCSNAAHWFREQPRVDPGAGMYRSGVSAEASAQLAAQAAEDWVAFLTARAGELAPGGRMLVQGIGTVVDEDGAERVSASRLLAAMWEVALELAEAGLLDRERLEGYVFPVYCRSAEEATAPMYGDLAGDLEVLDVDVVEVANPYWETLQSSGDRDAYAEAYTQFVRAFSESTLKEHLLGPGAQGADRDTVAGEFFKRFQARTAADPDEGRYEAWVLRVVFGRT